MRHGEGGRGLGGEAACSEPLPAAPRCARRAPGRAERGCSQLGLAWGSSLCSPSLCWLNSAGLLVLAQRCHGWGARGECGPTARGCPDAVPGLPVPGDRGLRGLLGSRAASPGEERRGLMKIGAQTSEQTVMFFSPCNDSPGL